MEECFLRGNRITAPVSHFKIKTFFPDAGKQGRRGEITFAFASQHSTGRGRGSANTTCSSHRGNLYLRDWGSWAKIGMESLTNNSLIVFPAGRQTPARYPPIHIQSSSGALTFIPKKFNETKERYKNVHL